MNENCLHNNSLVDDNNYIICAHCKEILEKLKLTKRAEMCAHLNAKSNSSPFEITCLDCGKKLGCPVTGSDMAGIYYKGVRA